MVLLVWFALHQMEEAATARRERDAALSQSTLNAGTGAIADRVGSERVIIIQQAEEQASAVEQIPSDDIPPDVLAAWRSGLRDVDSIDPIAERPAELQGAVSGTEP